MERTEGAAEAIAGVLRPVTISGVAGVLSGVLVGGVGGRIVMRISAIVAAPEATGALTENGNRVGEITAEGTVALLLFVGVLAGITGGIVLAIVGRWLPGSSSVRGLLFGGFLFATFGTQAIDANNVDFAILDPVVLNLALFAMLFPLFGLLSVWLARRLEDRPPRLAAGWRLVLYAPPLAIGTLLLIPTFGQFVSREFCVCPDPPIAMGVLLGFVAAATAWISAAQLRGRAGTPPVVLRNAVWVALVVIVAIGAVRMADEIATLL
jgi:hypothetical protein